MYSRISSAALAIALLTACGPESGQPEGETVECAIGEGAELAPVCTLEFESEQGRFIIHHPDGGFRRFEPDPNGGFRLADGSEFLENLFGFDIKSVELRAENDVYVMPLSILPDRPDD